MKLSKQWVFLTILVLAVLLRFLNYTNRWGLGYDQASFAVVGAHAVDSFQLPPLGPFSSSGPFQTGGMWYWSIMAGEIFFPGPVYGPWLFMGVLSVSFVAGMIIAGTLIGGSTMGILAGLLSAISTAQITQSTNLSNQTPIGLPSVFALIAALAYVKTKRPLYLFFLGLAVGAASSIHIQGLGLSPLIFATLLFGGVPTLGGLLLLGLGLLVPWLPVLWVDARHEWVNTKNMILYYLVYQYRISLDVLGRRWMTFGKEFIPAIWGFTIGGYKWMGTITIFLGCVISAILLIRKKITKPWLLVAVSLAGMFVIIRYTRVPLYESFVVFLHPFILLLTAGIWLFLFRLKKLLGILFIFLLVVPTMAKNVEEITHATNLAAKEAQRLRMELVTTFPDQTFALYDYQFGTAGKTLALLLYLNERNLISSEGHRVGVSYANDQLIMHPVIYTDQTGAVVYDLQSSGSAKLLDAHWAYLDYGIMYDSIERWWEKSD